MKFSTELKTRSKLRGHKKRRRTPDQFCEDRGAKTSWTEYKTIRQYQTMGDILEILKTIGYEGLPDEDIDIFQDHKMPTSNGYFWLTKDPPS